VDPLTQCRAYIELVAKDRANAQTEAAYFAARVQVLQEANKALEAKVQKLEAKPDGSAKGTK
jgi:RNAse (barnase) inhibitor barstar